MYLLDQICYEHYKWDVVGDLKMICFLTGLQGGYTKWSCYLCLWDSRADAIHFTKRVWEPRTTHEVGSSNVKHDALIPKDKIILPVLHLKLGIFKQLVKALFKRKSPGFQAIRALYPDLSDAKAQGGILTGPQIRKCINHSAEIEKVMTEPEVAAWLAFQAVVSGFLGKHKDPNYKDMIDHMLQCYKAIGCRMSIKLHFLHSHLDAFKDNLCDHSEEHGERFHQDAKDMEKRYMRQCNTNMMGDYIWNLQRDSDIEHRRKRLSRPCFKPTKSN